MDKKVQNLLFSGLVQAQYTSVTGRPTTLFGHLIEKYQFVEPRHDLIAEALWLLADPEGYRSKLREIEKKEVTAETVKKLKTEESKKLAGNSSNQEEETTKKQVKPLSRPVKNIFARN